MKFAYADPPYYKQGKRLYGKLHQEASVWDDKQAHIDLVKRLVAEFPDGWALSCNPADLSWLLAACPSEARVAAWCKTFHQIRPTTVQYAWEPVIFMGGRKDHKRKPMVRDWMACARTNRKGVPGAKPQAFNEWILLLLNYQSGDVLVDLFPGSGGMQQLLSTKHEI